MENQSQMKVTESMKENLVKGSKWAFFLAVMAAIGLGFMVLAGLFMLIGSFVESKYALFGVLYIVLSGLYLPIVLKSFKFVSSIKDACRLNDEARLEQGTECFRFIAKYCGIYTIAIIVLYVIIFIGAIIIGATRPEVFYNM